MKRSKQSTRTMRQRRDTRDSLGNSHYALKVKRGDQMYGAPGWHKGCCAHGLTSHGSTV